MWSVRIAWCRKCQQGRDAELTPAPSERDRDAVGDDEDRETGGERLISGEEDGERFQTEDKSLCTPKRKRAVPQTALTEAVLRGRGPTVRSSYQRKCPCSVSGATSVSRKQFTLKMSSRVSTSIFSAADNLISSCKAELQRVEG
jgi:hypothetical protein